MDNDTNALMARLRAFGMALLFAFLVAVSIAIFALLPDERERAIATESWPAVSGEVLSSGVRRSGRTRRASVRYAYKVGDTELVGDRIRLLEPVSFEWASTIASRYPTGAAVTVYYDPEQPHESVLEPGRRAGAFIAATAGNALLLVVAVGMTVSAVRRLGVSS